jgi:hypothetical protein
MAHECSRVTNLPSSPPWQLIWAWRKISTIDHQQDGRSEDLLAETFVACPSSTMYRPPRLPLLLELLLLLLRCCIWIKMGARVAPFSPVGCEWQHTNQPKMSIPHAVSLLRAWQRNKLQEEQFQALEWVQMHYMWKISKMCGLLLLTSTGWPMRLLSTADFPAPWETTTKNAHPPMHFINPMNWLQKMLPLILASAYSIKSCYSKPNKLESAHVHSLISLFLCVCVHACAYLCACVCMHVSLFQIFFVFCAIDFDSGNNELNAVRRRWSSVCVCVHVCLSLPHRENIYFVCHATKFDSESNELSSMRKNKLKMMMMMMKDKRTAYHIS